MEKPKKSGEQNFEKFTMVQRVQATMFGTVSQKNSPEIMKKVRQKIDELIQRGNHK